MDTVIGWSPLVISIDINYTLVKVSNNKEIPILSNKDKQLIMKDMALARRMHPSVHYRLIKQVSQCVLDSQI